MTDPAFVVNVGNAAAMDVSVDWQKTPQELQPTRAAQTAVAAGRRIELDSGYSDSRVNRVAMAVSYRDLDGDEHEMIYIPPGTPNERATHEFPRDRRRRWLVW